MISQTNTENTSSNNHVIAAARGLDVISLSKMIVSHTTATFENIESILKDGVILKSDITNLFGGKAFYVAENGYSINEIGGKYTITFEVSNRIKIFDMFSKSANNTLLWNIRYGIGNYFTSIVYDNKFDAISYNNSYQGRNFAIINNPQYLKPTGIYPVPSNPYAKTNISLPTIKTLQVLGIIGTSYALADASIKITKSDNKVKETAKQVSLLGAVIKGGIYGGKKSLKVCARMGIMFPMVAKFTVPICITSGSVIGAVVASGVVETIINNIDKLKNDTKNTERRILTALCNIEDPYSIPTKQVVAIQEAQKPQENDTSLYLTLLHNQLQVTKDLTANTQIINNLKELRDNDQQLKNYSLDNLRNDFSRFTNTSKPTYYTSSANEAVKYTQFYSNYINMNFCEKIQIDNTTSFFCGNNGSIGSKYCNSRFGNCSNTSNKCGSSSNTCKSSLF